MHRHIPKPEHQLRRPVVCTALPPHAVMGLGTIPFVNQMERFTVVLHLHRTWHFRLIPVPFPIDPHFVQHAQPNLQYVRAVEV